MTEMVDTEILMSVVNFEIMCALLQRGLKKEKSKVRPSVEWHEGKFKYHNGHLNSPLFQD